MSKGQSAIEYLMTYGWMLLVVAIAGGAVFSIASGQDIRTQEGFESSHIEISNFGVNQNNDLDVLIRNTASNEVRIDKINVSDDNGESVLVNGPQIDVAEERDFRLKFLNETESSNDLEVQIVYDQGGLSNLTTEGVIQGNLDLSSISNYDWWWDRDWNYRKDIQIKERSGKDLKDYQIPLTIDTKTLISEGKLESDCSDIRLVDEYNEKTLDYWIEEGCNSDTTEIYTRLNLSADRSKEIYLYYGNPGALQMSDGNSTLFLYELNGNGYEGSLTGSATYNTTDEYVEFSTPSGGNGGLFYDKIPKPGFEAKFQYYAGGGSGADATFLAAYLSSPVNREQRFTRSGYRYAIDEWQGNIQINSNGNRLVQNSPGFDIDDATWRNVTVRFDGEDRHVIEVEGNTIISQDIDLDREDTGTYFGWGGRTGGSTNYHRVRNLTVRKYAGPSPKINIGDEESP